MFGIHEGYFLKKGCKGEMHIGYCEYHFEVQTGFQLIFLVQYRICIDGFDFHVNIFRMFLGKFTKRVSQDFNACHTLLIEFIHPQRTVYKLFNNSIVYFSRITLLSASIHYVITKYIHSIKGIKILNVYRTRRIMLKSLQEFQSLSIS